MTETELLVQALVSGLLAGLTFSLIAVGLTLIYGVMDIVNFAHGEFLMLAMYATFWLYSLGGLDPLASLPLTTAMIALLGLGTYQLLIRRIIGGMPHTQIFATFGLMIFLQSAAQFIWGADYHAVSRSWISGRLLLGHVVVGYPQLVAGAGALLATAAVYVFLQRTKLGRALRATAQDRDAATLLGIDTDRMYALAWAVGAACVAVAGTLLATHFYIFPRVGTVFVLVAFATVALGGFGSIEGALLAGILIGVIEVMGGYFISSHFKFVFVYLIYLAVVILRPRGLLGRR